MATHGSPNRANKGLTAAWLRLTSCLAASAAAIACGACTASSFTVPDVLPSKHAGQQKSWSWGGTALTVRRREECMIISSY